MERDAIAESLWWVMPDRLAGVRKPDVEDMDELHDLGVGAIVSVLDDRENLDLYEDAGVPFLWLPVKGGTPPTGEQVDELVHFVDAQQVNDVAVAVHCTNGNRRTGTMLAAYLITTGMGADEALATVLAANPKADPRDAQVEFLRSLASSD